MRIRVLCLCLAINLFVGRPAVAQDGGFIEGKVLDAGSGEALPGARIVVTGSSAEASSNREGVFRLRGVPAGTQTVAISYLGRRDEIATVEVVAGATQRLEVQMSVAPSKTR